MLITLSRRTAICQSVAEVLLTSLFPLGAISHIFINLCLFIYYCFQNILPIFTRDFKFEEYISYIFLY